MNIAPRLQRLLGEPLPAQRDVISNLQFLRGAAAVLVVAAHLLERLVKHGAYAIEYRDIAWSLGEIGVQTFFAISGFIMVLTTAGRFGQPGASGSFLVRRFQRVAPLYYLTTAAWIAVLVLRHLPPDLIDVAKSFAFIPYRNEAGLLHPVYEVGWTLNYEMFFYLLFSLAMFLPLRFGLVAILATLLGLAATRLAGPAPAVGGEPLASIVAFVTDPVMLYFALGIAVATFRRWRGVWTVNAPDALICLGATLLMLTALVGVPHLLSVAGAITLTTLVRGRNPSRVFDWVSRLLGDASYAIYLTHSFLLGAVAYVFVRLPLGGPLGLAVSIPIAAFVAIVGGWLTWRLVETPVSRLLKRRA